VTESHPFHLLLPQQVPVLRRRALKLTANRHRAEDLVQDTLLKAWASRDSYSPDTRLRAWLFTILRKTFYSDLRKRWREVEDADGAMALAVAQEPCQEHRLALNELMSAMTKLAPSQREALVMMGAYGFSQAEAAEASGCSIGTIKSRVSRSRNALNQMLAQPMAGGAIQDSPCPNRHSSIAGAGFCAAPRPGLEAS